MNPAEVKSAFTEGSLLTSLPLPCHIACPKGNHDVPPHTEPAAQRPGICKDTPDEWEFMGTTAAKYRQIGNAVPVGLAVALRKAIIAAADHNAAIQTKRFRGTNIHSRIKHAIELGGDCIGKQNIQ